MNLEPNNQVKNFCFFPKSVYRWIKGEFSGTEEIFELVDSGFAVFRSKRKCNLQLLHEFMEPLKDGPDPKIENERKFNELTRGLEVEEITPEQKLKANSKSDPDPKSDPDSKSDQNPVQIILNQTKDKKNIKITSNLMFEIPSPEIISILKKSFPDNDIVEEVLNSIISQMSDEYIKKLIFDSIKESLSMHYKD